MTPVLYHHLCSLMPPYTYNDWFHLTKRSGLTSQQSPNREDWRAFWQTKRALFSFEELSEFHFTLYSFDTKLRLQMYISCVLLEIFFFYKARTRRPNIFFVTFSYSVLTLCNRSSRSPQSLESGWNKTLQSHLVVKHLKSFFFFSCTVFLLLWMEAQKRRMANNLPERGKRGTWLFFLLIALSSVFLPVRWCGCLHAFFFSPLLILLSQLSASLSSLRATL